MKKLLLIAALLCFAHEASAQTVTGTLTTASASCLSTNCVQWTIPQGFSPSMATATVQISGTFSGLTANFEVSGDAGLVNWSAITGSPTAAGSGVTSASAAGIWQFNIAGMQGFRVRSSAITGGSAAIAIQQSSGTPDDSTVSIASSPAGGVLVSESACSGATCFSSFVAGSAVSVGTTTVAPFGTTTTLVQGLLVNNICATAVQVTVADGNNNPMVGSETSSGGSFSLPAMSNLALNMGIVGHVFTSGLKASTVQTSNCVLLWAEGKQIILPVCPVMWWLRRRKRTTRRA